MEVIASDVSTHNSKEEKKGEKVYLPSTVTENILSRLPIESLIRFKIIDKSWYDLIRTPYFIDLQCNRSTLQKQIRLLLHPRSSLTQFGPCNNLYLVDDVVEGNYGKARKLEQNIMQGKGFKIHASCNGLVPISPSSNLEPLYICNPITRESLELPVSHEPVVILNPFTYYVTETLPKSDSRLKIYYKAVGLAFDNTINKYKVLRIYNVIFQNFDYPYCEIITLGDAEGTSWRALDISRKMLACDVWCSVEVFDGEFYWIAHDHERYTYIVALDVHTEELRTIKITEKIKKGHCGSVALKKLNDSLALVQVDELFDVNIWVLVDDKTKRSEMDYRMFSSHRSFVSDLDKVVEDPGGTVIMVSDDESYLLHILVYTKEKGFESQLILRQATDKVPKIMSLLGSPSMFRVVPFVPTFVSPMAAMYGVK